MRGLELVLYAAGQLQGERRDPSLPIPYSAIREFADRHRLSGVFCQLVAAYDNATLYEVHNRDTAERNASEARMKAQSKRRRR